MSLRIFRFKYVMIMLIFVSPSPLRCGEDYRRNGGQYLLNPEVFPFTARINKTINNATWMKCSGVIFSDEWIISAAHCFDRRDLNLKNFSDYEVVVGIESDMQRITIQNVFYPSTYKDNEEGKSADDDFALVQTTGPMIISNPKNWDYPSIPDISEELLTSTDERKYLFYGFSAINDEGDLAQIPKKIKFTLLDQDTCCEGKEGTLPEQCSWCPCDESKICGEIKQHSGFTCPADSGGPLVTVFNDGTIRLIGILSAGGNTSCTTNNINVFTYLPFHKDFIEKTVKEHSTINKWTFNSSLYPIISALLLLVIIAFVIIIIIVRYRYYRRYRSWISRY